MILLCSAIATNWLIWANGEVKLLYTRMHGSAKSAKSSSHIKPYGSRTGDTMSMRLQQAASLRRVLLKSGLEVNLFSGHWRRFLNDFFP